MKRGENFIIRWVDGKREPQNRPDPRYPDGMDLDMSGGKLPACTVVVPYPAKRCGQYIIECGDCGLTGMITTAGRADDPRKVKVACRSGVVH